MKSIVAGWAVFLLALVLVGCASGREHKDSATDNVVSIELRLDGQTCKPHVNPEEITARKNRPVVRWDVTDNCNQSEDEAETQLVFQYQQGTPRKWLDPKHAVARTTRTRNREKLVHVAVDRGQPDKSFAEYLIFYNGRKVGDPKVVWGR
jgi:hypothetical protein